MLRKFILTILMGVLMSFETSGYAAMFSLTSTSFNEGEILNSIYTCEGDDISPQLEWNHAPAKTVSFALILSDPDAPSGIFYHWVVFNLPRTVKTLEENMNSLPTGAQTAKNSWGKSQYNGPCPPQGKEHRYVFRLYALDTMLKLDSEADASSLLNAIQNHVVGVAELKAVFAKSK